MKTYINLSNYKDLRYLLDLINHFYYNGAWPLNYVLFTNDYGINNPKKFKILLKNLGLTIKRSKKDKSLYILKESTQDEIRNK